LEDAHFCFYFSFLKIKNRVLAAVCSVFISSLFSFFFKSAETETLFLESRTVSLFFSILSQHFRMKILDELTTKKDISNDESLSYSTVKG